ncbi:MAG: excinuclease ABC subunit UvrC [Candidatus Saganbacteria bacterium]|nr:excinuclease ABC subunit UvrC [Candidatus Saganbacteria bacterium]
MPFPDKPGVYLFKDKTAKVIYVGKAISLKKRLASYFSKTTDDDKLIRLLSKYETIDYIVTKSELEALLLEARLIKKYHPYFNVSFRDDKQYPSLKLTMNEEWPRVMMVRQVKDDGALYFGPFEGRAIRETIREIKRVFPIRWCKKFRKRQQPCLHYYIKHCLSPCTQKISRDDYLNLCRALASFLSGNLGEAINRLEQEMKRAAQEKRFEAAAKFRDKIRNLKRILQKQDAGILFNRHEFNRAAEAVVALKKALKLNKLPKRIEAFDVSNISGTNNVASMVVFENGLPKKSHYRKFKIRSLNKKANDVAAIFEVVLRRYTKTLKGKLPRPDLVLIDGGIAQVRAGKAALEKAKLRKMPVIGLAKREEEIFRPEKNVPIRLKKDSPALYLLQRVRDEAHRFAVAYHRLKRRKAVTL